MNGEQQRAHFEFLGKLVAIKRLFDASYAVNNLNHAANIHFEAPAAPHALWCVR